jgi:hypothetical protein
MSERSSVSRRVWRGALVALVAVALGTATTAGASDTGTSRNQQEGPAATAEPITPGSGPAGEAEPAAPGDVAALAASNLSYNTVDACRLFDTRQTGDGTVGAGRPVIGYSLPVQGFCGIPADGSAKALMVNVIAVSTRGTGYVRSAEHPVFPNDGATVLNFNNALVSSNAIPLNLCDTATTTCDFDLGFIVNGGSGHFVFDVVGYFA